MIYVFTIILAFCSVVYELLLGQTLSAFLGNTILRYSVTIGLYMFSMGIGSLLVTERIRQNPLMYLVGVEVFLSLLGASSIPLLFLIDYIGFPLFVLSAVAHGLIIAIGVLTGAEIPLLIAIGAKEKPGSETSVLGTDYIGAFAGTLVFAFVFYPMIGLIKAALIVAIANAVVGSLLIIKLRLIRPEQRASFYKLAGAQAGVLAAISIMLVYAQALHEYLTYLYLAGGSLS